MVTWLVLVDDSEGRHKFFDSATANYRHASAVAVEDTAWNVSRTGLGRLTSSSLRTGCPTQESTRLRERERERETKSRNESEGVVRECLSQCGLNLEEDDHYHVIILVFFPFPGQVVLLIPP